MKNHFIFLPDEHSDMPEVGIWVNMLDVSYIIKTPRSLILRVRDNTTFTVSHMKATNDIQKYLLSCEDD